jgi:spoIIIJ-associated protein
MKTIEAVGKTVEAATAAALKKIGLSASEVDITVLSAGGLFSKAKVRVDKKRSEGERAAAFIEGLLEKLSDSFAVELTDTEEAAKINIIGTDTSGIIGYRGEVLDSIQYLASVCANGRGGDKFKRIVVNCEGYREKREKILIGLAKKMESRVVKARRRLALEPMNPSERRIIHFALQDSKLVSTISEGNEPNRHIVVLPKTAVPHTTAPHTAAPRTAAPQTGVPRTTAPHKDK